MKQNKTIFRVLGAAWAIAVFLNLTAFAGRPGDSMDSVSLGWLYMVSVGPVVFFSLIVGIALLVHWRSLSTIQMVLAVLLVASPYFSWVMLKIMMTFS